MLLASPLGNLWEVWLGSRQLPFCPPSTVSIVYSSSLVYEAICPSTHHLPTHSPSTPPVLPSIHPSIHPLVYPIFIPTIVSWMVTGQRWWEVSEMNETPRMLWSDGENTTCMKSFTDFYVSSFVLQSWLSFLILGNFHLWSLFCDIPSNICRQSSSQRPELQKAILTSLVLVSWPSLM
jgi:hypothetical protein